MERKIKVGTKYKHFKGHSYIVIAIAYDSENYNEDNADLSRMIVYQDLNNQHKTWVRPYDMFNSFVDKEKYPDVSQKYRFEEIKED